jgi:hypothetical protein
VVDDPGDVLRAVAAILRPGGAVSVLVANQAAAVLARAMSGHLDEATALLTESTGPADTRRRRFGSAAVAALLGDAGLAVEEIHGVRVLADLVPAAVAEADPATLLALETRLSAQPPYRDIAAQLHLFARRSAS